MDVRDVVTWIVNPRLNRAVELLMEEGRRRSEVAKPGDDAWLEWSKWLQLAALLRKWRDWLARQKVWNAKLCRESLDKLAPIVLRIEGLNGGEEVSRLLIDMVDELEASVGLEGYFDNILSKLKKSGIGKIISPDIGFKKLDVHYMVTRIINPQINPLVSMLRESRGIVGRDGYTRVRWRMFNDNDYIASLLEIWVDDIWRKYNDEDLAKRGGELLDSLLEVTAEAEARLGESIPVTILWELARELERYLGLEGYIEAARERYKALVERKREERRRIAETLRRSKRRRLFARRSSHDIVVTKRGVMKKVVVITMVILAFLLLLFFGFLLLGLDRITVIPLQLPNSSFIQTSLQCGKKLNFTQNVVWKVLKLEDNSGYYWMRHNIPDKM